MFTLAVSMVTRFGQVWWSSIVFIAAGTWALAAIYWLANGGTWRAR
jgi:hypothetical protein